MAAAAKSLKPAATAVSATQRIAEAITEAILEHRLLPGTRLREEELAGSFAVSRTVVRQALHRLAQDRVVELQPNRGAAVPLPGQADAQHVFDARRVVECEVARRLAGRLDAATLARLASLVDAEQQAADRGDRPATIRLSGSFHRELVRLAGNPVFERLLDELLPGTSLLLALHPRPGGPACHAHRHRALIDVLRDGTPAAAAAEMRRHLREIEQSVAGPQAAAPARPLRDVFAAYRDT